MIYQMTAMMKAPVISDLKYPTVSLWMFCVVVTFLGVYDSLCVPLVMDDFEFPILFLVDYGIFVFLHGSPVGTVVVLFLFLWVSCGF